jgi:2,4-dienoyl-CoA reductase-like NADH-dependent reductase (Old Yellow Enzyme family)
LLVNVNGFGERHSRLTVEEAAEVGTICREAGVDGIEVSAGIRLKGKGKGKDHLRAIRKATNAVIIASGGFLTLDQMEEEVVGEKTCNLVPLSRPLIRQPDLVKLFREGKTRAAECINCNACLKWTIVHEKPVKCVAKK